VRAFDDIGRRIAEVRQAKLTGRRVLRSQAHLLMNGVWVAANATVWMRLGTRMPHHLRVSKGGYGGSSAPLAYALRALKFLVPPFVWVNRAERHGRPPQDSFTLSLVGSGQTIVMLEPAAGRVARTAHTPAGFSDWYVDVRSRYARHVPSVPFRVIARGELVVEELVDGAHVAELSKSEMCAVIRFMFDRYQRLVTHESSGRCSTMFSTIDLAINSHAVPPALLAILRAVREGDLLSEWPLVPSQGDLIPGNLIIRDGTPVVIDFPSNKVGMEPFFLDPVWLAFNSGDAVRQHLLAGGFDAELERLRRSAGAPSAEGVPVREQYLALMVIYDAHRRASYQREFCESEFIRLVIKLWSQAIPSEEESE
jgi:hypothetical protein